MRYGTLHRLCQPAVLAIVWAALICAPDSMARTRVRVGFDVNIALPPNVHVQIGDNYDPYYVGRVYYTPARVWRPVYAFPVETWNGAVVYRPYIYDRGQVVFVDYIPGPDQGYSRFVREGRGHYETKWKQRGHGRGHRRGR